MADQLPIAARGPPRCTDGNVNMTDNVMIQGNTVIAHKDYLTGDSDWTITVIAVYKNLAWTIHSNAKLPRETWIGELEIQLNRGVWVEVPMCKDPDPYNHNVCQKLIHHDGRHRVGSLTW